MSLRSARAVAVVDLGFGDAGKGALVDFLVRSSGAKLVVRFNGGAQAGHNVVERSGRHHTFAQFGAGTFAGARTHLSKHVVVHPTAALVEAEHLASKGVKDPLSLLSIDPQALVVTPFHQAAGRLREIARGDARHGSCGVGVGEVMRVFEEDELALRVVDLRDVRRARAILERLRAALFTSSFSGLDPYELAAFNPEIAEMWLERARFFVDRISVRSDEDVAVAKERVVLEGAQGVLLDERFGFHPYTTWSTCTFDNAREIAPDLFALGVVRTYAHRHGPGPLPTETTVLDRFTREPHNDDGPWQGPFRRGHADLVLARYARKAVGALDGLALTHLDAVRRASEWNVAERYASFADLEPGANLEAQAELTNALFHAAPTYRTIRGDEDDRVAEIGARFAEAFDAPLVFESNGPTADAMRLTDDR
ncbi:MAG TPA: adenylosuccinate synthetase [Polyangiaceae bacterium]